MRKKSLLCGIAFAMFGLTAKGQFYSIRTNVVGLATANLNAEVSMTLNRKYSLHIPVQYSPFEFSENKQFKNATISPGFRYWFRESYMGWFVGGHALASTFSIGNIWNKKRYEGNAYGAGISIGYAYPLSRRWNLECEIGGAAVWTNYNQYECKQCGDWLGQQCEWRCIPSRLALNIVYLF